jgi:hypothetical protein
MDQEPPVRRNTFVFVAAILFNLIWIALLFWSCQADREPDPTPTPGGGMIDRNYWILTAVLGASAAIERNVQAQVMDESVLQQNSHAFCWVAEPMSYNVPAYRPPSTCSITPVI